MKAELTETNESGLGDEKGSTKYIYENKDADD